MRLIVDPEIRQAAPEAFDWIRADLERWATDRLDWLRLDRGRGRYRGVYGRCWYPQGTKGYRLSLQVPGPFPSVLELRLPPVYRNPDGTWPELSPGIDRRACTSTRQEPGRCPNCGEAFQKLETCAFCHIRLARREWLTPRRRVEIPTLAEAIAWIYGHEAFHWLRHSRQIPGRNVEHQADAAGEAALSAFRRGEPAFPEAPPRGPLPPTFPSSRPQPAPAWAGKPPLATPEEVEAEPESTALVPVDVDDVGVRALAKLGDALWEPRVAARRPLGQLVEDALAAATGSEHTRRSYRTGMGRFLAYLDEARGALLPAEYAKAWRPFAREETCRLGRYLSTTWHFSGPAGVLRLIDAAVLDGFRQKLEAEGLSPGTVETRRNAARVLLSVALRDQILSPTQGLYLGIRSFTERKRRNRGRPPGRRLSPEEVRKLRAAVPETLRGVRDLAVLDAMLFGGLRRGEVERLALEHLVVQDGRLTVEVHGKGNKIRALPVPKEWDRSLRAWLERRELHPGEGEGPVFVHVRRGEARAGEGLKASGVFLLVRAYGAKAGLAPATGAQALAPHDLRRTMARNAYDRTGDLLRVQHWLGHEDPQTTAVYIGIHDATHNPVGDAVDYSVEVGLSREAAAARARVEG